MYETHFGLRHRPFRSVPDRDSYYPATGHERALARLRQSLAEDEGLALLTGEPGTGKTLLGHCLIERIGEPTTCAFLTNSRLPDRSALLQAVLFDLSLPYERKNEQELRLALTEQLLKNLSEGRHSVVILDEAHHLTPDLLEELRLLGNLETGRNRAIRIVLLAQPTIEKTLRRPELASLCQRLTVRLQLEPLGIHEAADYLVHHLRSAGGRPERILSDEAVEVLSQATRGIPRLLNQAAHQSLSLAYESGAAQVDAEIALEALAMLGLNADAEEPETELSATTEDAA